MTDPRVAPICSEYGVTLIGKQRYPEPGETRAVETMSRILSNHGEAHFRLVMSTLAETENNKGSLDQASLWAASDLIRACRALVEANPSEWLSLWDAIPLGQLQRISGDLSGVIPQRHALGGMLYERIVRRFGPGAAQPDLFDDRRMTR